MAHECRGGSRNRQEAPRAAMFANAFRSPYVDIFKLFAKDDWKHAEQHGDVSQVIDKAIGKRRLSMINVGDDRKISDSVY